MLLHAPLLFPTAHPKTHHPGPQSAAARAASTSGWPLCSQLLALASQARTHCLGEGDTLVGRARGQVTEEPGTWTRLPPFTGTLEVSGSPAGSHSSVQLEQFVTSQSFLSGLQEAVFAMCFELKTLTFGLKTKNQRK